MSVVGVLATRIHGHGAQGSVSPEPQALQKVAVGKVVLEAPRGVDASVHFTVDSDTVTGRWACVQRREWPAGLCPLGRVCT